MVIARVVIVFVISDYTSTHLIQSYQNIITQQPCTYLLTASSACYQGKLTRMRIFDRPPLQLSYLCG
jgi:hypothetical protein